MSVNRVVFIDWNAPAFPEIRSSARKTISASEKFNLFGNDVINIDSARAAYLGLLSDWLHLIV